MQAQNTGRMQIAGAFSRAVEAARLVTRRSERFRLLDRMADRRAELEDAHVEVLDLQEAVARLREALEQQIDDA